MGGGSTLGLALVSYSFETRERRLVFGCSAKRREASFCSKWRRKRRRRVFDCCCQMNLTELVAASSSLHRGCSFKICNGETNKECNANGREMHQEMTPISFR